MGIQDVHPNTESPRRAVQRVARLERRLRQIDRSGKTFRQAGEVSALKWAIPILEEYINFKYGKAPNKRVEYWKHEYETIKENLIADFGNICYICGNQFNMKSLTIDHYIPIASGGADTYSNYRLCCKDCNEKKGRDNPSEVVVD